MVRNNLVLQFSPSSKFNSRSLEIPFTCTFKASLPGQPDAYDAEIVGDDLFSNNKVDEKNAYDDLEEMYVLLVDRQSQGGSELLAQTRSDSANVSPGDILRVRTDFETRAALKLAIEKCWLSPSPAVATADGADESDEERTFPLVDKGCSAGSNVTVLSTQDGLNPSFILRLGENLLALRRIYIFCRLGLCSPVESLATGNIVMVNQRTI